MTNAERKICGVEWAFIKERAEGSPVKFEMMALITELPFGGVVTRAIQW